MPEKEYRQGGTRSGGGRILILSVIAMLAGYFIAGRAVDFFRDSGEVSVQFETMNTYGSITLPKGSGAGSRGAEAAELAKQAVLNVNALMSPFGETSDIRRLNEAGAGQWIAVSPETWTVVMEALRWHRLSEGAFDPTIGPIKRLFTFDRSEADEFPDEATLAAARERVGAEKLRFDREGMRLSWAVDGMRLDLGAIAKGYAADLAADALLQNGVKSALIEIGGELRLLGVRPGSPPGPWKVGIRSPSGDDVHEKLELANAAVATSGDYERFFVYQGKRYEHIIDPRIGLPIADGVASVTVIHPNSCLAADALATTMCVLGPDAGRDFLERQALGLFSSGVRVIMLTGEGETPPRRIEFEVEAGGTLSVVETPLE